MGALTIPINFSKGRPSGALRHPTNFSKGRPSGALTDPTTLSLGGGGLYCKKKAFVGNIFVNVFY